MKVRKSRFVFLFLTMSLYFFSTLLSAQDLEEIESKFIAELVNTGENDSIQLGKTIYKGVFTGNGLIGTMTFLKDEQTAIIRIGRTDLYDHRPGPENLFLRPRLPLGEFHIQFPEGYSSATGKMDVYNGASYAYFNTPKGRIVLKAISLSEEDYILLEFDESAYSGEPLAVTWEPAKSESPRLSFDYTQKPDPLPEPNPEPIWAEEEGRIVCFQSMRAGGGYGLGHSEKGLEGKRYFLIATDYRTRGIGTLSALNKSLKAFDWSKLSKKLNAHENWWHQYYQGSSLVMPDQILQNFYNFQLYKLASATRSGKPALDLQGPWTDRTPWPGYWMNLNMQLSYSPLYTAKHLELAQSLIEMIDRNEKNLTLNVPEAYRYNSIAVGRSTSNDMLHPVQLVKGDTTTIAPPEAELGNLTWLLYYYHQHYLVTQDKTIGKKVFNLLKKSINYHLHLLEKNENGKYHISVKTYSPEYGKGYAYDTNYDLAILRWGLRTLLKMDEANFRKDKLNEQWRDVLNNLIEYPKDDSGFLIAQDVPYEVSHRHYSHLMMIYPFQDVNWDQLNNRKLIEKSIATWQSKQGAMQGYSLTGLASMKATMGKGEEVRDILKDFIRRFVKPNTLYAESGPVIETPLSAMTSIQEMYIQHRNDVIHVFPAIPKDWEETSFRNFRVPGAFLISGTRITGVNNEVSIYGEKGGAIRIKPGLPPHFTISGKGTMENFKEGVYTFKIPKGGTLILKARN